MCCVWLSNLGDRRDNIPGHTPSFASVVSCCLVGDNTEERGYALGLKRILGISYKTAWTCLHKLRRAMVRPGREKLSGRVEVDESYIGGLEEEVRGRETKKKRW